MADDFFTRQLPHNVTWALTLLYALDMRGDLASTAVQVCEFYSPCTAGCAVICVELSYALCNCDRVPAVAPCLSSLSMTSAALFAGQM